MFTIFSAFLGAFGFGSANVVIKKSLSSLSFAQTLTMSTLSGLGWLLLFMIATRVGVSFTTMDMLIAAGLAVMEVSLYLIFYKMLDVSNVTISTSVSGIYPILATLVLVAFFNQVVTPGQWLAIITIILGALILSVDWVGVFKDGLDKRDLVKGWPWILATMAIHTAYYPLLGQFTAVGSWETKLLLIKVFSAVVLAIIFGLVRRQKVLPPKSKLAFTSLLGLLELMGWAGFAWANSGSDGQTAVVLAVLNSAAVVTAVLAYFFLKEKLAKFQYFGIFLIIAGLTWLSFK